ncbi:hypothetical protein TNCV_114591 [Trichonephila clavipes]|nr:hypothetical protein TNCV_114591 [Trichonephila clavipes]
MMKSITASMILPLKSIQIEKGDTLVKLNVLYVEKQKHLGPTSLRANGLGQSDRRKVERLFLRPTDSLCRRSSRIVLPILIISINLILSNPINSALNSKILMRRYVPFRDRHSVSYMPLATYKNIWEKRNFKGDKWYTSYPLSDELLKKKLLLEQ